MREKENKKVGAVQQAGRRAAFYVRNKSEYYITSLLLFQCTLLKYHGRFNICSDFFSYVMKNCVKQVFVLKRNLVI